MRAVVQRVDCAGVSVNGTPVSSIGRGLLVLAGLRYDDTEADLDFISDKITGLRIFDDSSGTMNLSVSDISGELLIISQFTLYGDVRKGRRPSYSEAMPPEKASKFFDQFVQYVKSKYPQTKTGIFGADMKISLENSGPVTILLDSRKNF